jgi:hypothetical protein
VRRLAIVAVVALAACSSGSPDERSGNGESRRPGAATAAPRAEPVPSSRPQPTFDGSITPVDAGRLPSSWRLGCPVPVKELRLLTLDHWGYDGAEHRGELVVHADYAEAVLGVFRTLFDARFPIERMELVDVYGGDDHASTRANNTAGFNCRSVVGSPGTWSEHAYGRAVDVNPLVNPYVLDPHIGDPELARYLDRSLPAPGMIRPGDPAVVAFAAIGWAWGGYWDSADYQHFSATGH